MQVDWDDFYRSGRYLRAWELSMPSPELDAWLAGRAVEPGACALDLGCGSGNDCLALARAGYRVHGIDISGEAIAIARRRMETDGALTLHQGDVLDLPFGDQEFDLVADRGCLHHLSEPQRPSYAREIDRVLKRGGLIWLRGCRARRVPFTPLTDDVIGELFPDDRFDLVRALAVDLVTDAGALPATCYELRKR